MSHAKLAAPKYHQGADLSNDCPIICHTLQLRGCLHAAHQEHQADKVLPAQTGCGVVTAVSHWYIWCFDRWHFVLRMLTVSLGEHGPFNGSASPFLLLFPSSLWLSPS